MSSRLLGFVVIAGVAGIAGGYLLHAALRPRPVEAQEWVHGQLAGFPNAYNVRPLK